MAKRERFLDLVLSANDRPEALTTAIGRKLVRKPVKFDSKCPKCSGIGTVVRNQNFILWFDCHSCGNSQSWRRVSGELRSAKVSTSKYCPLDHNYVDDCGECEMCPE